MNAAPKNLYLHIAVVAVLSSSAVSANAADFNAENFAEDIYMDFSRFSDGKIAFEVTASKPGSLAEAANLNVASFLPLGSHVVNFDQGIIDIDDIRIKEGAWDPLSMEMRQQKMSDFEDGRLSMSSGIFRILSVKAFIGKEIRQSQAVEFCWPAQGYCYVEDNSIPNLWAAVKMIREVRASGYKETITYSSPEGKPKAFDCKIRGRNDSWATVTSTAANGTAMRGSRQIGTWNMPGGSARVSCVVVSDGWWSKKCEPRVTNVSLPTPSSSASRGYQSSCSVSATDTVSCGTYGAFEKEQGCAWGAVNTNWSFSFTVPPATCSASVTHTTSNTVATHFRAFKHEFDCESVIAFD